jgi:hypothetical protein
MNDNFLQHVAEQMAHLKFGEDATEFNEALDKCEFTTEAQEWINLEIQNLKNVEQQFDMEEKEIVFGTFRNGHDPRIIAELNKTLKGYQEQDILQELFEMYFDNSDLEDVIEFFKSRQHEV